MRMLKKLLGKPFDNFLQFLQPPKIELTAVLQALLADASLVADMGCGEGSHLRKVKKNTGSHWMGIDLHQPSLDAAKLKGIYDTTYCSGIIDWLQSQQTSSIDTILASCVIEHLDKKDGFELIYEMKRVCSNRAIIFTPIGFVPQPGSTDNPANAHLSGWGVDELEQSGFGVDVGLYGFRKLRTSFGLPSIKPPLFGDLVAKLTSRFVFHRPKLAYQIVGVHQKSRK